MLMLNRTNKGTHWCSIGIHVRGTLGHSCHALGDRWGFIKWFGRKWCVCGWTLLVWLFGTFSAVTWNTTYYMARPRVLFFGNLPGLRWEDRHFETDFSMFLVVQRTFLRCVPFEYTLLVGNGLYKPTSPQPFWLHFWNNLMPWFYVSRFFFWIEVF